MNYFWNLIKERLSGSSGGDGLPIGSGMDYFGTTAPSGYMFADGSAISRTKYAELFAIIGTTYGAGDGSTTFNLPDKREAVTIMKSASDTLGTTKGSNSVSYTPKGSNTGTAITKAQLPSYNLYSAGHSHTFTGTSAQHRHGLYVKGGYGGGGTLTASPNSDATVQSKGTTYTDYTSITPAGSNSSTTITVASGGSGQAHNHTFTGTASTINVMQKSLVCNYIIKVSNDSASSGEATTPTLINFTVKGITYQAEEGMTWAEWCDSEYNTTYTYYADDNTVYRKDSIRYWISGVSKTDVIITNHAYTEGSNEK